MSVDVEVAVVGGGPVGMLLAGELALYGVRTAVLEQLPAPTGESKAGTLHARTAQALHRRGLRDAVQPGPHRAGRAPHSSVPFHFGGLFDLDLAPVVDEGPALLGSPQAYAEDVFARRAARLGAGIRRGARVTGVVDRGGHVELSVSRHGGGEELLRAHWVVGCDGAGSAVRKSAGIPFTGTLPTMSCLMGEVRLRDPYDVPAGWQRTPRGWTIFWVDPEGHSRVGTYDFRGPHPDRKASVTLAELRAEAERITGREVVMESPRWLTRFSDAALQAERYRRGRVLLAGDAAHVHFPAGGQGVNTGLQDVLNLGWKLAAEAAGTAPSGLLDSYHDERHPVAAEVLYNVRAQVALMNPDPAADALRRLFAELMGIDEVNNRLAAMVSGTAVTYDVGRPRDPLAGRFVRDTRLTSGRSAFTLSSLLHSGRGVLLDLADREELREAAGPWAAVVDTVTARAQDGPGTGAVLLRPDGYAAWSARGSEEDAGELRTALRRWFGDRPG